MKQIIRIGTRKSDLAVIQAKLVAKALEQAEPGIRTELVYKVTEGDRILDRPLLSFGGKGVFVTEFEKALQKGEIDFAVHSAKDLPMDLAEGLAVVGVPERGDPGDVLVTMRDRDFGGRDHIVIGTSSLRRKAQIEAGRLPAGLWAEGANVCCENLRGNVLTRLKKLESGSYDGEVLAAAGLKRLGLLEDRRYRFTVLERESFIPAGGQGILAVEGRRDDRLRELAERITHKETKTSFDFERKVLRLLGAGCHEPAGVYSVIRGDRLYAWGYYPVGPCVGTMTVEGPAAEWEALAESLAGKLGGGKTGFVWLVGAGPGDPGLITEKGADCLKECTTVVYDYLSNDSLLNYVKPDCRKIYVGKKAGAHSAGQEEINSLLVRYARRGDVVVRLKGGDPYVFGRGGEEVQALQAAGIPCEVVPGVTSAVAALSSAGIPVTHRGLSRSFHVMTGHTMDGREGGGLPEDFPAFAKLSGTLVFLMGLGSLSLIVEGLLKAGRPGRTPAAVIESGTLPGQRVVRGNLETIADLARSEGIGSPAIIAVGDTAALDLTAGANMPLSGIRFGLTGTEKFLEHMGRRLRELGAVTATVCCMEVRSLGKSEKVQRELGRLKEYTWLVFTSANGVRIFLQELLDAGQDYRSLGSLKIAAVGSGTRDELRRHGFCTDYVPEAFCTESLAEGLAGFLTEKDWVLIPRSAGGSRVLNETLENAKIPFCDLALYDVAGTAGSGRQNIGQMDYLVFGSASGVDAVFAGGTEPGGEPSICGIMPSEGETTPRIACIGRFTAARLEHYGLRASVVSEVYDVPGLADSICKNIEHEMHRRKKHE